MKKIVVAYCLLTNLASCLPKKCNENKELNIISKNFFCTISVEIPNVIETEHYHQMPDNSNDCITSIDEYRFIYGYDTGVFEIEIPLRGYDENLHQKYDYEYYSIIENELKWTRPNVKNYQKRIFQKGNTSLYGFVFDDGFKLGTSINRGSLSITLTGIKDTLLREKIIKSVLIKPTPSYGNW